MAYDGRVYRILIASPSDVEEERDIAVRVIQQWNDLYSYSKKVVLLPMRWETHAAPDYATRPQEVINKALVDECDLVVGIFWTRIGSPTGVAVSGTLEEIERAGNAHKPIMLYFSNVEIDPDKIDISQIEKLKAFKLKTYPRGLVEHYRVRDDFRDKFSRQLEIKLREMQKCDKTGRMPLSLEFLSLEQGEPVGNSIKCLITHPRIKNYNKVPADRREFIRTLCSKESKKYAATPVAMILRNTSASGVRNVYVELEINTSFDGLEITEAYDPSASLNNLQLYEHRYAQTFMAITNLAKFEAGQLQRTNSGWMLSFEWEAIQPQRSRLIRPLLSIYSQKDCLIAISAKVFADPFPEPLKVTAELGITTKDKTVNLENILPDWEKFIALHSTSTNPTGTYKDAPQFNGA